MFNYTLLNYSLNYIRYAIRDFTYEEGMLIMGYTFFIVLLCGIHYYEISKVNNNLTYWKNRTKYWKQVSLDTVSKNIILRKQKVVLENKLSDAYSSIYYNVRSQDLSGDLSGDREEDRESDVYSLTFQDREEMGNLLVKMLMKFPSEKSCLEKIGKKIGVKFCESSIPAEVRPRKKRMASPEKFYFSDDETEEKNKEKDPDYRP